MQEPPHDDLKDIRRAEEERLAQRLAQSLGLNYRDLSILSPEPAAVQLVPEEKAKKSNTIPIYKRGQEIEMGALNPGAAKARSLFEELRGQGYKITPVVVSHSSLERAWRAYEHLKNRAVTYADRLELTSQKIQLAGEKIFDIKSLQQIISELKSDHPLEALDVILAGAVKLGASDIHCEPTEKNIEIKYRIDGLLYLVAEISNKTYDLITNRIKVAAGLFLNITSKPQDGRLTLAAADNKFEIRVSTIPSAYGETIVMRLLDEQNILIDIQALGLRPDHLEIIEKSIKLPNGLILNTGPTGSGKTTTLYALLHKIQHPEINIVTIEDPIEYHLAGISQTQVNVERDYTFASGLRSILRQDPDVILVGEIRDEETAQVATQAALTGHLVISTLHTNNALGAIPRLLHLNVDESLIPSSLRLIIAQRLIRQLCLACKKEVHLTGEQKKKIETLFGSLPEKLKKLIDKQIKIYQAVGCNACHETGYKGRTGVFELIEITESISAVIAKDTSESDIYKIVQEQGFTTLYQDGLLKFLRGETTFEEVERVLGVSD